ncbi:hypothetical protein BaRGS_00012046 [Batillaria attramentaria]|uniref:Cyclase n=1 Tax=Batillaria attramentaria TaxID=370345 RepID=A0ABD0LB60_9CAEN
MAAVFLLASLSVFMTSPSAGLTVIDMTFDMGSDLTVAWPGNPPFNFTILSRGQQPNYWYESNYFGTPEHAGTHVDAPAHFNQNSWRVHDIPASRLVGPAVVIDVSEKAASDPDYRLSVDDIQSWEKTHGRVPDGAVVLMNSGRDSLYPNATLVFGTDTPTDPSTFHFPGIHPDAATFLTEQRDVTAVGVDTPSTDYGQSRTFETHVILARHNILGLENVRNMNRLPPRGATIMIGLVNLYDGSGGPARILGIIDGAASRTASGHAFRMDVLLWVLAVFSLLRTVS